MILSSSKSFAYVNNTFDLTFTTKGTNSYIVLFSFSILGEMIKTTVGEKLVKVYLLSGVFDAPAKSQFQNIVQFNGEYGCSYCLEPGKTVKVGTNGRNGHTHSFPFNFDSETGHTKMRTHSETVVSARKAQNDVSLFHFNLCFNLLKEISKRV